MVIINVDCFIISQLLIISFAFTRYYRKYMNVMDQLREMLCTRFYLILEYPRNFLS